jgi:hypothetical protein
MAEQTAAPGRPTEEWTYLGQRVMAGGTKGHAWLTGDGKEWYFAKVAATAIGGTYRVTVECKDDGATVYGKPAYLHGPSRYDDDDALALRAGWEAEDAAARARLAAKSAERSAAKRSALDLALAPLEDIARKARTGADRDALIAHVIRRLNAVW